MFVDFSIAGSQPMWLALLTRHPVHYFRVTPTVSRMSHFSHHPAGICPPAELRAPEGKDGCLSLILHPRRPGANWCPVGTHLPGERYLPFLKTPARGARVAPVPGGAEGDSPSSAPTGACAVCPLSAGHGSAGSSLCTCGTEKHRFGHLPREPVPGSPRTHSSRKTTLSQENPSHVLSAL